MIFISAEKLQFAFYLSVGLLSLPRVTECDKIRLVGPSRCSGRVEVFYRDSWGTVCDDHWSIKNAEVVCREANCGTAHEAKSGAFFGQGKDEIWLDDVQCGGHESSIFKCEHKPLGENNCGHGEDAGVVCSEHVRVMNGSVKCSGRVEVYHDGRWKRVCNSEWGKAEADVVCREISCGPPLPQTELIPFGEAHGLSGVKTSCFGNETSLSECSIQESPSNCVDATVVCSSSKPIRLVNGTNRCSGRVELYHAGQWGTVCDDRWGMEEATVACQEMNCGSALTVKFKAFFGMGKDQVWMDDVDCVGNEGSLSECRHRGFGEHDCDHNEDAGVICSETVRLLNGTDRCSGRLEIFHGGKWGKVCDNNWGLTEAKVVCKELDCGTPKTTQEKFIHSESSGQRGYLSRCIGNVSSIAQCVVQESLGACEGVSLTCTGNPPLRLVNGTDRCSGRVEILHAGLWGTVCDDEWDMRDAQVVCRAVDCGTAQTAKSGGFFGEGEGNIWMDDVNCFGNESSLLHCQRPSMGENNCGHGEDAGVVCSATIRLINGTDQCSGKVEFYHNGQWSPALNLNWGMNEAAVVCREMNCGDAVRVTGSSPQGVHVAGYKVSCAGRETSLTRCILREYVRTSSDNIDDAAVVCSGNVKLSDGANRCVGRVEFYDKGRWGTVCGESWDMDDAAVVCQQLNCGRVHKITTMPDYGHGSGQVWIDQIECNGRESTLSQCQQRPYRDRTCNTTSVAGITCTESLAVRLVGSPDHCSGRVEVLNGEVWSTVCDADWTMNKAEVVCELLECGHAVSAPGGAQFQQGTGPVMEATDSCFSNVTSLNQCSLRGFRTSTCGHENDAGIVCAAQLRVVGGNSECSGRVEIFHQGQWGTVCDDEWEMSNADVVCRQLGCGHAISAPTSAHFGRGTGPIWLDNVGCTGEESALTQCSHIGFGQHNCGHGEDASVICLSALVKPQISLSPSSEVNWGERLEITCTVVTEHLGGTFVLKKTEGSFKMERYSDNEAATFVFTKVDFSQAGSYFCEYKKKLPNQVIYFPQGNVAEVSVTVKLDKPSISLTSPHAMVIYSPNEISVSRGDSFSITCSIHSIYPGGYFYLTRSNVSSTEAIPAFGHQIFYLANFEFPAIEDEHQGAYSCVYGVNISSKNFCSIPSKTIQVTVVGATSSSAVSGIVIAIVVLLLLVVIGYVVWRKRRWGAGTMVKFSSRFAGATQEDVGDRGNGVLDDRSRNTQITQQRRVSHDLEDKDDNLDPDNPVEGVPEDLAGKVCYELEPLVLS